MELFYTKICKIKSTLRKLLDEHGLKIFSVNGSTGSIVKLYYYYTAYIEPSFINHSVTLKQSQTFLLKANCDTRFTIFR